MCKSTCWLALLTIWPIAWTTGCMGPWRPSTDDVVAASQEHPTLAECLQANRLGRWVYQRRALPIDQSQPASRYVRDVNRQRSSEGILVQRRFMPLESYLQPQGGPASQPGGA